MCYSTVVTKPLASRSALQMNETVTICDLLINGCAEDGNGTAPEVTPAPLMLDKNKNKTSISDSHNNFKSYFRTLLFII